MKAKGKAKTFMQRVQDVQKRVEEARDKIEQVKVSRCFFVGLLCFSLLLQECD
jgi:hypothetical protein